MVSVSPSVPQVRATLWASLDDPDDGVRAASWAWSSASSRSGAYTPIAGTTSSGYSPVPGDAGRWLRVSVSYRDAQGSNKSASHTLGSAVLAGVNNSPSFASTAVVCGAAAGTAVGAPVTASDPDGDVLHYSLSGTGARHFEVGSSSGQIRVASGVTLRFGGASSFVVTVWASDGRGRAASATVTIYRDVPADTTSTAAVSVRACNYLDFDNPIERYWGSIDYAGDRDYIAVELEAGTRYWFDMLGAAVPGRPTSWPPTSWPPTSWPPTSPAATAARSPSNTP